MMWGNFMKRFEYFDVTADIGFKAYGESLDEAFENAATAMFNIISDTSGVEAENEISFEVSSQDEVSLLYDFLEELLFYHETEFMLFSEFHVDIKKTDENFNLKARIRGEEIDWDRHERKCEIKAITFHMMDVKREDFVELRAIVDL